MEVAQDEELFVWDTDEQLQTKYGGVVYWQNYDTFETDGIYSVSKLVENNGDQLRSQYLALIYELGEAKVNGIRVVEYLEIRPDFSYWWMTLLTEKCNFAKSPQIDNAIKMMAFKQWFKSKNYKHISLVSPNAVLAEAMHLLADELCVGFEWKEIKEKRPEESIVNRIYKRLPYYLQAFAWLTRHLVSRWSLKGVGVDKWKKTKAKATFVSYLFNLDSDASNNGYFDSRYWTALPQVLDDNQIESNWLHIYLEDDLLPNAKMAKNAVKRFNQSHEGSQVHVTLHSFLNLGLVFSALSDWYKLFRLRKLLRVSLQEKSGVYWPFLEEDYLNSMVGPTAMSNLLYLHLFKSAMSELPFQEKGVYLQENQGWELGFIYSWRAEGHGDGLVGMPHVPSKFWDLRSYFDPRSYEQSDRCSLPLPDCVAINGEAAKKMYLHGGYPEGDLVEVEALRYLHLNRRVKHQTGLAISKVGLKTLLVLGDYLKENTAHQMKLLQKTLQYIDNEIQYLVKAHPACPILAEDYPDLDLVVTNDPIPMLMEHCSLVYTSSTTSAAVDAYCSEKAVVTVLDPKGLNLSPLKGSEGVSFVGSPEAFAAVLNKIGQMKDIEGQGKDYFYLDPELPRWRELLVKNDKVEKQISLESVQ